MPYFFACMQLFFCFAYQAPSTDAAQFKIERPAIGLSPTQQAILVNPEGEPVVFRLDIQPKPPLNAVIRAELIGPSLTAPISINQPADQGLITLDRSTFSQPGIYELTHIRLELNGNVLNFAEPSSAEIQVSDQFLVTEVSVTQLSEQDLLELGYIFHPDDYVAVSFKLGLSIETKPERVDVSIPVVFPKARNSSFRPQVLRDPFSTFQISPIIISSPDGKNIQGDPVFTQEAESGNQSPMMGLILIPGQLKYLKSHFAVSCVLMNAAPEGYSVRASNMVAELRLPSATPAGLPLTINEPTRQAMVNLGLDGSPDTADDTLLVDPGQQARAKYVITGNVPGFHDFEVFINGDLQLPQGQEPFATRTKAAVYVRNPDYALSFEHPEAVEADEPYDLTVRIVNTGQIALESFQIVLDGDRLQGVRLADGQHPVQNLSSIPIGGETTATYRLRSQVTGQVVAGYVKINEQNQADNAVQLRVAVGDIGQQISPYTLHFAQSFYDAFPPALTDALKRYAKKALDTSMTANHQLPDDLLPTASRTVRAMNRAFVRASKGPDYGMTAQESLLSLFREWVHPQEGYLPLDHIRRKLLNLNELPMETAFGEALFNRFPGATDALLTQMSQENEDLSHFFAFIVDAAQGTQFEVITSQGKMNNQGLRDLPFGTIVPLTPTQSLVWVSHPSQVPVIKIQKNTGSGASAKIYGLFGSSSNQPRSQFQTATFSLTKDVLLTLDSQTGIAQLTPEGQPSQDLIGTPVAAKPFELVSIGQLHKTKFGKADHLGRHHRLFFSAPIDLQSLYPLEEHLTINDQPIVFGELQSDKRTLIVTSSMPLGPYHPISYRLKGAKAKDGQVLGLQEGSYTGSSSYTGVSIAGRVTDRMGSNLSKARAFLWVRDRILDPNHSGSGQNDNKLVPRIVQELHPDANGQWQFDYAPTIQVEGQPDPFLFQTIKVAILLEDGRYQEQEFRPQGAGQIIAAEFAFFQLGNLTGQITANGSPVPFTKVFVASENNPQSAAIVETNANGFYRANNIQVGQVIIKASHNNEVGIAGGYLTAYNSPLQIDLEIATPSANLAGTVTQSINGKVKALANAVVGFAAQGRTFSTIRFQQHNLSAKFAAITQTDEQGQFQLENVPAGVGEIWFYYHDHGLASRQVLVLEGETQTQDYQFQLTVPDSGTVEGYVETNTGTRVEGARVSLGRSITFTDATGFFRLAHVPKNTTSVIRAHHPDLGSGQLGLTLDQDLLTAQTIVLFGSVPLSGTYVDANGEPVPFTPVYMSYLESISFGGYQYYSDFKYFAHTDFEGKWEGRGPKETVYRFTGFSPPEHAYSSDITVGPTGLSGILLQKSGLTNLRVRLVDAEGEPVVGKVDLKTLVPNSNLELLGQPSLQTTHSNVFTDENGYANFQGLSTGQFEVFGHLEALGQTDTFVGTLSQTDPASPQTVTLAFPPPDATGNLFGTIYQPGGVDPAPDGTIVRLKGPGVNAYVYSTLAGTYRFEDLNLGTQPVRLELVAYNPNTQHFYRQWLDLNQDLNFRHDLILKKRMSVHVHVEQANGEPADFAEVHADFLDVGHTPVVSKNDLLTGDDIQAGFTRLTGQITPQAPVWIITEIPTGPLVLKTVSGNGLAGLKRITLPLDRDELHITVRLETSSQISGIFLNDQDQPLSASPVALKQQGDWLQQVLTADTSGQEGSFLFDALPMGRYQLEGTDPATARLAHLNVFTSPFRPAPHVTLRLDPVTQFSGIARFQGAPVPNATIILHGRHLKITTGTDANGRFQFSNLPLGPYTVQGSSNSLPTRIYEEIQLSEEGGVTQRDLAFGEVRDLHISLLEPDGSAVSDVLLKIYRRSSSTDAPVATSAYTDTNGLAILRHLPMGRYVLQTERLNGADAVYQRVTIHEADANPSLRTIQLAGTGTLLGKVTDSLGQPLNQPVHVKIAVATVYHGYQHHTITTRNDGSYRLEDVAVNQRIEVTAFHPATHEVDHQVIQLDHAGQELEQNLSFLATTTISGKVTFLDGNIAPYAIIKTITPLRNYTRADEYGDFSLSPVLQGTTTLYVEDPISGRQTKMDLTVDSSDGVHLDPISDLSLVLGGVSELSGTISFANNDPVRFGFVRLQNTQTLEEFRTRIQGDGSYFFSRLPLGTYSLVAYSDQYGVETQSQAISLDQDQGAVVQNHLFENNFTLTGIVYAPNRIDPSVGASVSLWRQRTNRPQDGYERVYEAQTDTLGAYTINYVFPGTYLLKANNTDFSAIWEDAQFVMTNQNQDSPVYLETVIPLLGTLADASERPFTKGHIQFLQDGQFKRLSLDPQGNFSLPNIQPIPYRIDYSLADGWIEGSYTENAPSATPISLRTADTVTLTGRAILAKDDPPARPRVYMKKDGISRRLTVGVDGSFSLSHVPVNEAISLHMQYDDASRSFDLGSFTSDTNLGDFYLDYLKPEISYPLDGQAVTSLPHSFEFNVTEDEPNSDIDPNKTSVWVNGKSISSHFLTSQTTVSATFDLLPEGFVLGSNTLTVRVFNTSNRFREVTYTVNVNLAGPSLVVDLELGNTATQGQIQVDQGPWQLSSTGGRFFLHGLTQSNVRLKAKASGFGSRRLVELGNQATQFITLDLKPVGTYRGQVTATDGAPLSGIKITLNQGLDYEISDANGEYVFDLLPWDRHRLWVNNSTYLGSVEGPAILNNQQVFLNIDLELNGRGTVAGIVYDDDGVTPIANSTITLRYTDLPASFPTETVTANSQGAFQFNQIATRTFRLTAKETGTTRVGFVESQIPAAGETHTVNILLAPNSTITGTILDKDGNPAAGAAVRVQTVYNSNGTFLETQTGNDGNFQFVDIPRDFYKLYATRDSHLEYLDGTHYLSPNQPVQNFGTYQMVLDTPPHSLEVVVADPYHPGVHEFITIKAKDDRNFSRWKLTLSDAFQKVFSGDSNARESFYQHIEPKIPTSTPNGNLHYHLEIWDHLDQRTALDGDIALLADTFGPQVTVAQPADNAQVWEGQSLDINLSASDPSGISNVTVSINGAIVGQESGYFDPDESFSFSALIPGVESNSTMPLAIVVTDRKGNSTNVTQNLNVQAISTTGAPTVSVLAPLANQPLPFWLEQGLEMQFAATAQDPDGLGTYSISINSQEIISGLLSGTEQTIETSYALPADFQNANSLDITWTIRDIGGIAQTQTYTVQKLTGSWLVKHQADPLYLPGWYQSPPEERNLLLVGGEHIIDGTHQLDNLVLVNGAVLTQTASTAGDAFIAGSQIHLSQMAIIDYASALNVDGKGYLQLPISLGLGSGDASHGGLGKGTSNLQQLYGSPLRPIHPGSHRGGGAIGLHSNHLWLLGNISASAASGTPKLGSGGSIWISATQLTGSGQLIANGFTGSYADSNQTGGGGGRISCETPTLPQSEAFGGKNAGAGTVFHKRPDTGQPDGFYRHLIVANHPDSETTNKTWIRTRQQLVVGTDITITTDVIDNETRQVVQFQNPAPLAPGSFLGMRVFTDGNYGTSVPIAFQTATSLQSAHQTSFGSFSNGDLVAVDLRIDELTVTQNAWFEFDQTQPATTVSASNAKLISNQKRLPISDVSVAPANTLELEGQFQNNQVTVLGTLVLNGQLHTNQLDVDQAGQIQTPSQTYEGRMDLVFNTGTIAGILKAPTNGIPHANATGLEDSHGGIGGTSNAGTTYGSLYKPITAGNSNNVSGYGGGIITLQFQNLNLTGSINTTASGQGSGGSITLSGSQLSGNGQLIARGGTGNVYPTGGGRIAVFVDDLTSFAGTTSTRGSDRYSSARNYGGSGTVFYQNTTWPNGRLVVDNEGLDAPAGSTLLPGIGNRTVSTATGGTRLDDSNLPPFNSLVGMFVTVDGHDPVKVLDQDANGLLPDGSFPTLAIGASYGGLHRLDVLEVRNGAKLKSIDPIEVLGQTHFVNGEVDAQLLFPSADVLANGSGVLSVDPGWTSLELDNYQLTVDFPLNLQQLTLKNGSSLIYRQPAQLQDVEIQTGSSLEASVDGEITGLTANNLIIRNGAIWTVANRKADKTAYSLRASITGQLTIETGGLVTTSGASKVATVPPTWAGAEWWSHAHGGLPKMHQALSNTKVSGSFADPNWQGSNQGGGIIRIVAAHIVNHGSVEANGYTFGTGGSILIQAPIIEGTGQIKAEPTSHLSRGGGRIAIHYGEDNSFLQTMTLATLPNQTPSSVDNVIGAGTIFLKGSQQTHGDLVIDQHNFVEGTTLEMSERFWLTGITGLANITLNLDDANPDPLVIQDLSWTELLPGMAGLTLEAEISGSLYRSKVVSNTHNSLVLKTPLPATVPANTKLHFILELDNLTLKNGAQLYFPGVIELNQQLILEGPHLTSLAAKDLKGLSSPWTLNNQNFRLNLETPTTQGLDVALTNTNLFIDRAITFQDLNLTNSWLQHSLWSTEAYETRLPNLSVSARHLVADATSGFDVSTRVRHSIDAHAYGSPRPDGGTPYGSLFQPEHFGSGTNAGGRMRVVAQSITGGSFLAKGTYIHSGGSVWIDAQTLSGAINADAGLTGAVNGSGGRIAIYYGNKTAATITTQAYGSGAGGTIFLKDHAQPYGDLQILSNSQPPQGSYITSIPHMEPITLASGFTASFDAPAQTTTLTIPGLISETHWAGYHLVLNQNTTSPISITGSISDESQTQLQLAGDHSTLQSGDHLQFAIVLDHFDMSAGTHLELGDLLLIYDNNYPTNHVFQQGNGTFLDAPQTADNKLILDDFQMVLRAPASYDHVELRNGATLRIDVPGTPAQPSLSGNNLQLLEGKVVADSLNFSGAINVSATSTIEATTRKATAFNWPAGSPIEDPDKAGLSFGGIGSLGFDNDQLQFNPTFGSFSQPWETGLQRKSLRIQSGSLHVDGHVSPELSFIDNKDLGGGALWITTGSLSGNGKIDVNVDYRFNHIGGGGRVAVYFESMSNWAGAIEAKAIALSPNTPDDSYFKRRSAPGTVFLKQNTQTYGELHVIGSNASLIEGSTGVVGLGRVVLSSNVSIQGQTLTDSSQQFPYSLKDLYLVYQHNSQNFETKILSNTATSITVADPLPDLMPGDEISAKLHLDRLVLEKGAQLYTPDHLVIHNQLEFGARDQKISNLWARALDLPSDTLSASNQAGGLSIEETTNLANLTIDNSEFELNLPLSLTQLTLQNTATLTHRAARNIPYRRYAQKPAVVVEADTISVDATSKIEVTGKGYLNIPEAKVEEMWGLNANWGYGHGGNAFNMQDGYAYGTPYQPESYGFYGGAGRIHLKGNQLTLQGSLNASGTMGGSIWLEIDQLSGDGLISANGGLAGGPAGTGGRIALYFDQNLLTQVPQAKSPVVTHNSQNVQYGAGTVYLLDRTNQTGSLLLHNDPAAADITLPSPIHGIGSHTLSATPGDPKVLTVSGANWRYSLAGHVLEDTAAGTTYKVLSNTTDSLTLDRPVSPAPTAGWAFQGKSKIDQLSLENALVQSTDPIVDVMPPVIQQVQVTNLVNGALIGGLPFNVHVTASDNFALASVSATFDGQSYTLTTAPWTFNLTAPTPTTNTNFDLVITATDTSGLQTTNTQSIAVDSSDTQGPSISFIQPQDLEVIAVAHGFDVVVQVADPGLVDTLQVSFNSVQQSKTLDSTNQSDSHSFSFTTPFLTTDTAMPIQVTATDLSGNQSQQTRNIMVAISDGLESLSKPIAYFTMDEIDRDDVFHFGFARRHIATSKSTTPNQTGQIGQAVKFGSSRNLTVANSTDLTFGGKPLTVSAWVNPSSYNQHARIMEKTASYTDTELRFMIRLEGYTGKPRFAVSDGNGNDNWVTAPNAIPKNAWSHVVGVSDGTQLSLYINGALVDQIPWPYYVGETTSPLHIGSNHANRNNLEGNLDEMGIWPSALTASEVALLYQFGLNGITPDVQPPEEVTSVTSTGNHDSMTLTWTASANSEGDLAEYRIYQNGVLVADQLPPATTSWNASTLQPATIYTWRIAAVDTWGNQSRGIQFGSVTTPTATTFNHIPKPVAGWTLDATDILNNKVQDAFGSSKGTVYNSTTGEPGKVGDAVRFTTDSDRIIFDSNSLMDDVQESNHSLAIWFRVDELRTKNAAVFMKRGYHYGFYFSSWHNLAFGYYQGSQPTRLYSNSHYLPGTYHHVVATVDQDNGILRFYVDGKLHQEKTFDPSVPVRNYGSQNWRLGEAAPSGSSRWPARGAVDEPKLWNTTLTAEDVAALYQSENSGFAWDFDAPENPGNFTTVPNNNSITLSWTAPPDPAGDLQGYLLWVNNASTPTEFAPTTTTTTITGLTPESLVTLKLASFDHRGNQSPGILRSVFTLSSDGTLASIPQPLVHYPLDPDGSETTTTQETILGHHGQLNGTPTYQSAIVGDGLNFSTNDDAVVLPHNNDLRYLQQGNYTLSTWFKPNGLPPYNSNLDREYAMVARRGYNLGLYYSNEGKFRMIHFLARTPIILYSAVLPPDQFYHVAGVVNATTGTVQLFVDGILHDEKTYTPGSTVWTYGSEPWRLGETDDAGYSYRWPAKGILDEVYIWNTALNASQVTILHQATRAGNAPSFQTSSKSPALKQPKEATPQLKDLAQETQGNKLVITNQHFILDHYQSAEDLVLVNSEVEVIGDLQLGSLELLNGSVLRPLMPATSQNPQTQIRLEKDLFIDSTSTISLDGMGLVNDNPSHGGLASNGVKTDLYGSAFYPHLPGGGEAGGGALSISACAVDLEGAITARGIGFSAGGSIILHAVYVAGNGHLDVSGGLNASQLGGGGRLALYAMDTSEFTGQLFTGRDEAYEGTAVILNPERPGIHMFGSHQQLLSTGLPFPIWVHPIVYITDVHQYSAFEAHSRWEVSSFQNLELIKGHQLTIQGKPYLVHEVTPSEQNKFTLIFRGDPLPPDEYRPFILLIHAPDEPNLSRGEKP